MARRPRKPSQKALIDAMIAASIEAEQCMLAASARNDFDAIALVKRTLMRCADQLRAAREAVEAAASSEGENS